MINETFQTNNAQRNLIEAALFISTKPINIQELMRITGVASLGFLKETLKDLQREYFDKGLEIAETHEGWQMQVKKEYLPQVSNLTPHSDLSEGCKKTLALVIYKEPLKQSDLVKMQGTKAYVYVKELLKKNLLRGERRGHTKILKVTSDFEQYFGESKESIRERIINSLDGDEMVSPDASKTKAETEKPALIKEPEIEISKDLNSAINFLENASVPIPQSEKQNMTQAKNLKPIKRERPVKVILPKQPKEKPKIAAKKQPVQQYDSKIKDSEGLKELTVEDLK